MLGVGTLDQGSDTASSDTEGAAPNAVDNAQAQEADDAGDNAEVSSGPEQPQDGDPVAATDVDGWLIQMEEKRLRFEQQREKFEHLASNVKIA